MEQLKISTSNLHYVNVFFLFFSHVDELTKEEINGNRQTAPRVPMQVLHLSFNHTRTNQNSQTYLSSARQRPPRPRLPLREWDITNDVSLPLTSWWGSPLDQPRPPVNAPTISPLASPLASSLQGPPSSEEPPAAVMEIIISDEELEKPEENEEGEENWDLLQRC